MKKSEAFPQCVMEGCEEMALFNMVWPGREPQDVCPSHLIHAGQVAKTLGFTLPATPIQPVVTTSEAIVPPHEHKSQTGIECAECLEGILFSLLKLAPSDATRDMAKKMKVMERVDAVKGLVKTQHDVIRMLEENLRKSGWK